MDVFNSHPHSENDFSSMTPKPLSMQSHERKLMNIHGQTPNVQRRKLGNLNLNTPLVNSLKKNLNYDICKPVEYSAQSTTSSLKSTKKPLPVVVEDVENVYPLTVEQYRNDHFPLIGFSEHKSIHTAPFEDEDEILKKKFKPDTMSIGEYIADIF